MKQLLHAKFLFTKKPVFNGAALTVFLSILAIGMWSSGVNAQCLTTGSFTTSANPSIASPYLTASADFNGDGKPDLVSTNNTSGGVTVYLGNGDGTFGTGTVIPVGSTGERGIVTADFNGDGKADIAVANQASNNVSILLGNGNGTFATSVQYSTGAGPYTLTLGDFNGDGKPDLVTANGNTNTLTVLINSGTGTFTTSATPIVNATSNAAPQAVAVADFNGDGKLDLASCNQTTNDISVFIGVGDGTFGNETTFLNGLLSQPWQIATADFDGDGKMDLAVNNRSASTITVLKGNGAGSFATFPGSPLTGANNCLYLITGDFNNDGKSDIVSDNYGANTLTLFLGNGSGGFTSTTSPAVGSSPWSISSGDFNNDGKLDLVATNSSGGNLTVLLNGLVTASAAGVSPVCSAGTLSLTGGPGTGVTSYSWSGPNGFTSSLQSPSISSPTTAAAGVYTLTVTATAGCTASARRAISVFATPAPFSQTISACGSYTVGGITHTINGTFTDHTTSAKGCDSTVITTLTIKPVATHSQTLTTCNSQTVTIGTKTHNETGTYVDRLSGQATNGCDSIVTTNLTNYFGSGAASFSTATNYATASALFLTSTGDFNGDGKDDIAVATNTGTNLWVLLSNGTGFASAVSYPTLSSSQRSTAVGDFNGDGKPDVVVANQGGHTVSVFINNGAGTFATAKVFAVNSDDFTVATADFNGDGLSDIATANGTTNNITVLLNNGAGGFTSTNYASGGTTPVSIISADFNGDGKPDIATANPGNANTNAISIFLNNGDGTFPTGTPLTITGINITNPCQLSYGDYDHDGKMDLAIGNNASTLSVLKGNGSGGFTNFSGSPFSTGSNVPFFVATADFNGDGNLDLISANRNTTTMSIYLGNGSGGFAITTAPATTGLSGVWSVSVGDFNGDGKPDFVVGNNSSSNASVFLNTMSSAASATASPTSVCTSGSGSTLTLTGPAGSSSYAWSGPNSYTSTIQSPTLTGLTTAAAGVYTLKVTDSHGCTATANTAVVSVGSPKTTSQTISACGSYTVGSTVHTSSGTYNDVLTAKNGCDSTVTTILTINTVGAHIQTLTICAGQSVMVGTTVHSASGTYVDRIGGGSSSGCDSIVTTNLTVLFGTSAAPFTTSNFPTSSGYTTSAANDYGFNLGDINNDGILDLFTGNYGGSSANVLLGNGSGGFNISATVSVSSAAGTVMADFNNDGKPDLAVTSTTLNTVSIFLGNGAGGFSPTTAFSTPSTGGTGAWTPVAADFNGDGKMDLAVGNGNGGNTISVLMGKGDGTFQTATNYTVGSQCYQILTGDFNGDGKIDIASPVMGTGSVIILKGNGDGTFNTTPLTPITGLASPRFMTSADFNGDGKPDLAVILQNATTSSTGMIVYLGNGIGGFGTGTNYIAGTNPQTVTSGDYNGDGNLDLAVGNYNSSTISIFLGNGSGGFNSTPTTLTYSNINTNPQTIVTGDFNGDGKPDLATGNYGVAAVSIWLNQTALASVTPSTTSVCSSGSNATLTLTGPSGLSVYAWKGPNGFTSSLQSPTINNPATTAAGIYTLTVTDSHSCTATAASSTIKVSSPKTTNQTLSACGSLTVGTIVHTSSGTYTDVLTSGGGCDSTVITHLTINSPELVRNITGCPGQSPVSVFGKTHATTGTYIDRLPGGGLGGCDSLVQTNLSVIFGSASTTTFTSSTLTTSGGAVYITASGDFNGDGKPDIVATPTSGNNAYVYLNNGAGGFTAAGVAYATGSGPRGVTVGDFNGDGKADFAVANQSGHSVSVWINKGDGSGTFIKPNADYPVNSDDYIIINDDFNGDGKLDLATANGTTHDVSILLGNGAGGFGTMNNYATNGTTVVSIASGDFNGDGYPDLAIENQGSNNISILMNNSNGTFNTAGINTFAPAGISLANPTHIIAADFDKDGKIDIAFANSGTTTISVLKGDGTGHFANFSGSPFSITAVGSGVAFYLQAADFNGDGILDIAECNRSSSAGVFFGNGSGGFSSPVSLAGTNAPWPVTVDDFNGDGKPDVAIGNNSTSSILVYLNNLQTLGSATATPVPVCTGGANSTLTLNGNITGISTYKWVGPGGYSSSLQSPVIVHPTTANAGIYTFVTTESHGCTISTNIPVAVNSPKTFSQTVTACGSYTIGNTVHKSGGTFTDVISTAGGCDSTVTTILTINPLTFVTKNISICAGQSYTVGTATHTATGTYVDRIVGGGSLGCDLIQTTNLSVLFGPGTTSFNFQPTLSLSSGAYLSTVADFNGDGKADIVATSNTTGIVTYFKGNGDGTFAAGVSVTTATGVSARGITSADFNGDGKMDLAVANQGASNVYVLLGNGNGTFGTGVPYGVGLNPYNLSTGDFNNDGKIDLVVGNTGTNTVTVLLNNGSGVFTTSATPTTGAGPGGFYVGDFNGDGNMDFASANLGSASVSVLLGNGSGGFGIANTIGLTITLSNPGQIAGGDLNGDGNLDLVVNDRTNGKVYIMFGNGAGAFPANTSITTGSNSLYVVTGDFNNDGKLDIISDNYGASTLSVLLGNGAGSFTNSSTPATGSSPWSITPGDFNGDGKLDIASMNSGASTISILLGDGIGGLGTVPNASISGGGLLGTCADFNSDGVPDLIYTNSTANLQFLKGIGNGTFTLGAAITTPASTVRGVVSGDFNGDGKQDLAIANQSASNNVLIYLGNGNGTFTAGATPGVGSSPYNLITSDFNGDGKIDLAVANNGTGANTVTVLLGNGSGGFATVAGSTITIGGTRACDVVANDFNNDGIQDIAVCNSSSSTISFALGNGDGSFGTVGTLTLPFTLPDPSYIVSGDFDGDGKADLAVANRAATGQVYILKGNGTGGFSTTFTGSPFTVGTQPLYITTADFNGDGHPDIATGSNVGSTVSVLISNGSGGFNAPYTLNSISNPWALIAADFNGDGKPDLAADASGVSVFLNLTSSLAQQPVATTNSPVCSNGTLNLTGAPSGLSVYSWLGPNSYAATGQNIPIVAPGVSGAGTYTLAVTDSRGCSGSVFSLPVVTKSLPNVSASPASAVCTGLTNAILTASGGLNYSWAPSANLTPSNATGVTETAQISQLTFYTVTGSGSNGCSNSVVVPVATVATGGTVSPAYSIICSGGAKLLTVTGAAGHNYQWQISSDNVNWSDITGGTNTVYTTNSIDGNTNKYYRLMAQSNSCWDVASTTAEVDVSQPAINITTSALTDNSITLNWTPVGSGNYNINYNGASSGAVLFTTPPKTLTGLTANGNYTISISQTGTGLGGCPASGTASVTTLCAAPPVVNVIGTGTTSITLSWSGGAGNYRVYFRPLYAYNGYFTKDVINGSSTTLTIQGGTQLYHSVTYEIFVSKLDCPTLGSVGQPSPIVYATTTPALACTAPTIDSVRSICPVQIEVWMHGSPTNQYYIDVERLTPTIQPVTSYPVSGSYFTMNVSAGQNYLITARSICGGAVSNMTRYPNALQIKPQCGNISNLLLSNPTCDGFTASWNSDQCIANNASYYQLFMRQVGTINWNSYPTVIPTFPIGPYKVVSWLGKGKTYDVYARAVYSCNGYLTFGATTQTLRITTLSAGCREEEGETEEARPLSRQTSADNSEVFSLYPNPNSGNFTVDLTKLNTDEEAVRIEVTNILGQTVITHLTSISDGHMTEFINLPQSATSGTYVVRVTAGKNVYTSKLNISK